MNVIFDRVSTEIVPPAAITSSTGGESDGDGEEELEQETPITALDARTLQAAERSLERRRLRLLAY